MKNLRTMLLLVLVGLGLGGTLAGCVIEDGDGWHHHHHDDWR